ALPLTLWIRLRDGHRHSRSVRPPPPSSSLKKNQNATRLKSRFAPDPRYLNAQNGAVPGTLLAASLTAPWLCVADDEYCRRADRKQAYREATTGPSNKRVRAAGATSAVAATPAVVPVDDNQQEHQLLPASASPSPAVNVPAALSAGGIRAASPQVKDADVPASPSNLPSSRTRARASPFLHPRPAAAVTNGTAATANTAAPPRRANVKPALTEHGWPLAPLPPIDPANLPEPLRARVVVVTTTTTTTNTNTAAAAATPPPDTASERAVVASFLQSAAARARRVAREERGFAPAAGGQQQQQQQQEPSAAARPASLLHVLASAAVAAAADAADEDAAAPDPVRLLLALSHASPQRPPLPSPLVDGFVADA
ncbi:hypothetical protein HK405_015639, partial [Cladochytrium tenue]